MIVELANGTLRNLIHSLITVYFLLILVLLCIIIAFLEYIYKPGPVISYQLAYDPVVSPLRTLVKMHGRHKMVFNHLISYADHASN